MTNPGWHHIKILTAEFSLTDAVLNIQQLKGDAWTEVGDASSLEIEDDQGGEMESASQLDVQVNTN